MGIFLAFWIQFGCSYLDGAAAWRLALGLQMIVRHTFFNAPSVMDIEP